MHRRPEERGRANGGKRQRKTPRLELLSRVCGNCSQPFATVSPKAEYCSDTCRIEKWRKDRKCAALVDALMDYFEISVIERKKLERAVTASPERFYRFAEWLGFVYRVKRYTWEAV